MKRVLTIIFILLPMVVAAQSKMYRGNSTYISDILCTYDGKYLYNGNSTYSSDIVLTYDGRHVYDGRSTYSSDILYTIKGSIPIAVLVMLI